jgi:hypothetical protein
VGLREFEAEKCDIIHKYTSDEARALQAYGELPATARINQTAIDLALEGENDDEDDVGFDFDGVSYFISIVLCFVVICFVVICFVLICSVARCCV